MQTHRIISGLTVFLMVVLVAAGWFLVAQPQLAAADTANKSLAGVQSQTAATRATITRLMGEQKKLPSLTKDLAALRLSIPAGAESSAYINGLDALAAASGVTITELKLDDPVAYSSPAPAAPAPAAAGATPSPTPTPAPTPTATPKAAHAAAAAGWTPPSDARITGSNFIAIPVSVSTSGDWPTTLAFIKGLQSGQRLFLVTGLSTELDTSGALKATVKGYIYVLLDPKSAALDKKAAAAATPAPTPTPTVTPSPTVTPNPSGSATPTPTPSPTPTK
jgi:Tfp pilus assembly protein PilO